MADNPITWGIVPEETFERVLLFSPHFDDAALGAAHMLGAHPDSLVVTVFGGPPAQYPDPPSEWDALGGFQSGDDVVAVRREEDAAALKVLEARPLLVGVRRPSISRAGRTSHARDDCRRARRG